jgi:hypothetical protein
MKAANIFTIHVIGLVLLSGAAQQSTAIPLGRAFTYQGRLIDADSTADGLYDFQFELYSDPCLSSAVHKVGNTISVDNLDVVDGYFTAELDFGPGAIFTGDARWLEIAVAPDGIHDPPPYTVLSPRQKITPTPYALYAASGPGVPIPLSVSASSPEPVISGTNTGAGHAIYGKTTDTGDSENYGGYFEAAGEESGGVYGKATGEYGRGACGLATGTYGRGVYGYASNTANTTNYGGYFKAAGRYGRAVFGQGTGESSRGVWGETSGKYGIGVQGTASGEKSYGVYGFASKTGDVENYGGYFQAAGDQARAVYGKATATGDFFFPNYGGYFESAGVTGVGVLGEATSGAGIGVRGRGLGGQGIGVLGEAPVIGEASGVNGIGVVANGKEYDFMASGDGINYGAGSSIRWKTDIRAIDDPLGKVMNLRGVHFKWDAEHGGGHDIGMIAEEVGQVLPEIVAYEENGTDASGMDYSKLTPLLVEAVKALKNQFDQLQKENLDLRDRLEKLEITAAEPERF